MLSVDRKESAIPPHHKGGGFLAQGFMKTAKHPSGETITFTEENHRYVDSQGREYTSVTTFIHNHFPEFDTEKISALYAKKHGRPQQEVIQEWEDNKKQAADYGTRVHAFAEAKLKNEPLPKPTDERDKKSFKVVNDFIENILRKQYKILEIEKIIFSPKHLLAGTVDLLVKDKKGNLHVLDWKSNKAIKFGNGFQSGLGVLSQLDDCNFNHYSLQLNIYRKLLYEEGFFRSANNAEMGLLHIRRIPDFAVQKYPVARMDNEMNDLFQK